MYLKTAVIAYSVGRISKILSENTAYLIDENNENSFTSAILAELKNLIGAKWKMLTKWYHKIL